METAGIVQAPSSLSALHTAQSTARNRSMSSGSAASTLSASSRASKVSVTAQYEAALKLSKRSYSSSHRNSRSSGYHSDEEVEGEEDGVDERNVGHMGDGGVMQRRWSGNRRSEMPGLERGGDPREVRSSTSEKSQGGTLVNAAFDRPTAAVQPYSSCSLFRVLGPITERNRRASSSSSSSASGRDRICRPVGEEYDEGGGEGGEGGYSSRSGDDTTSSAELDWARSEAVWLGGSVLADMDEAFLGNWVSREEWDEYGAEALHLKCQTRLRAKS